ncbi:hypothetical protein IGI04_021344, partial [Brassica rapa subsp. trilocularis]
IKSYTAQCCVLILKSVPYTIKTGLAHQPSEKYRADSLVRTASLLLLPQKLISCGIQDNVDNFKRKLSEQEFKCHRKEDAKGGSKARTVRSCIVAVAEEQCKCRRKRQGTKQERNQSLTLFPSSQSLSKDVASLFEISLLPRHKSWPKKIWALNKI